MIAILRAGNSFMRPAALTMAAAVLLLAAVFAVPAQATQRVALVIGNAAYKYAPRLANPLNDMADIGAALGRLGFTVTRIENADQVALRSGLQEFKRTVSGSELALIFYAGHGIEVGGSNYLVPVDAKLETDQDIDYETVPLDLVMKTVQKASGLGLVILDACRDNPFAKSMTRTDPTRSVGRGLARPEPSGEILVAYAAEHRTKASDGTGRNSPYSKALLRYLEEPELEVQFMFRKVRDAVLKDTGGRQKPFEYGSLSSKRIYLGPKPKETAGAGTIVKPGGSKGDAVSPEPDEAGSGSGRLAAEKLAAERSFWESVRDSEVPADIEAYLTRYPRGTYATLAENRLKRLILKPGRVFRDCAGCPEMAVVPAGSFTMGSPENEVGRNKNEGPQHHVTIPQPFAVGRHEVTREEFTRFVAATGHSTDDSCWIWENGRWKSRSNRGWRNPGFTQTKRDPVVCVSWHDAKAYVRWLSSKTGRRYRLLSEAEWEYAARAGTAGPFHFGSTISTDQANYHGNYVYGSGAKGLFRKKTVPVGSYPANAFGLHDMHGNVWEWVEDCWHASYDGAPSDGGAWTSGGNCGRRVLRGGSWVDVPGNLRAAVRVRDSAGDRNSNYGFRVARTLTP